MDPYVVSPQHRECDDAGLTEASRWPVVRAVGADRNLLLLMLFAGAAWVYIAVRAARLAIVVDEYSTYGFFHGDTRFISSANNHWLNSWGVRVSEHFFGQSELALRLPNVAAFGIYIAAVMLLVAQVRSLAARLLGFALLMANPFLLEFFGLARGYGLSMAFVALGLAGLLAIRTRGSSTVFVLRVTTVCGAGLLAVYANIGALNVVVVMLAVLIIVSVVEVRRGGTKPTTTTIAVASSIVAGTAVGLVPAVLELMALERRGDLYYGGKRGLLPDTLISLVQAATYRYTYPVVAPPWAIAAEIVFVILLVVGLGWVAITAVGWPRRWGNVHRVALVGFAAVAAVQVQALWRGTLYPLDRTALVYLLPFACFAMFFVADTTSVVDNAIARKVSAVALVSTVLVVANFVLHANLDRSLIWRFNASDRQLMDEIMALKNQAEPPVSPTADHPWTLIAGFPRNESLNYYRVRDKLTWLKPVLRAPVTQLGGDLYYVAEDEVRSLPFATRLVHCFPRTKTQLRVPADGPLAV